MVAVGAAHAWLGKSGCDTGEPMLGKEVGAYRILEKIGQGGMGIVYKGIHVQLEQEVAIKVLSTVSAADPSMRERFIQEAKLQARLTHPHVINILNYLEDGEDIFLVMEYVQGDTLEKRLTTVGSMAPHEAVSICQSVLSALDFMHAKGVIHRDIKPGNIMFTDTGLVKVTDFGIAKVAGEQGQTKTGMLIGTLGYISPEQIQGKAASVTSDLYALGITLYRMVTGKLPFDGDSEYTIMQKHIETVPEPPWIINSHIPQALGRVILRALEKAPEHRYQSAHAFAEALTGLAPQPGVPQLDIPRAIQQPSSTKRTLRLSPWRYVTLSSCTIVLVAVLYVAISGHPMPFKPSKPVAVQPVPTVDTVSFPASMPPSGQPSAEQAPHRVPTAGPDTAMPPHQPVPQGGVTEQKPASSESSKESTIIHAVGTTEPQVVREPQQPHTSVPSDMLPMPPMREENTAMPLEPGLGSQEEERRVASPPHNGAQDKDQPPSPGKEKLSQQRGSLPPKKANRGSGGWYIKK